jgi:hypothetical protein
MAALTQRFIDTLKFHKDHQGAEGLDNAGLEHLAVDQQHAGLILSVVEEHQADKTTDEEFKQQLLDMLEQELFKSNETMSKTMIRNILREHFDTNVDPIPQAPSEEPTV